MASSSFQSSSLLTLFTPISEHESEEEDESSSTNSPKRTQERGSEKKDSKTNHNLTPFHTNNSSFSSTPVSKIVDFNRCRPSYQNTGMLKSAISNLAGKKNRSHFSSTSSSSSTKPPEEKWKVKVVDLSKKLSQATMKRDEALAEVSQLKQTVVGLETKLARLDSFCHELKFLLSSSNNHRGRSGVFPSDDFLHAVQESRKMIKHLGRVFSAEIGRSRSRHTLEKIAILLKSFDLNLSIQPRHLDFYLEVLLNEVFYEDFESAGFDRRGITNVLDPFHRCQSNKSAYDALKELSWEEVLADGTRHHNEELGEFCDRKMSAVASMLGWVKPWPKTLLKTFFWAAKWTWLLHLLARSVHPAVPLFRVGIGCEFDPGFMDNVGVGQVSFDESRNRKVKMMVAPGFYVYSNVVKCKVLCMSFNTD